METTKNKTQRVPFIDEVRGFAIICMVVYHFFYLYLSMFPVNIPFFYSKTMYVIWAIFAGSFIFISGTACRFSRNNLERGVICFGCGILVTVVTQIATPEMAIRFGILHMLGISMILYHFLAKIPKKVPTKIAVPILSLLFFLTYNIRSKFIYIPFIGSIIIPQGIYELNFFPIGFYSPDFSSSDYFSLFPWFFLFFLGTYFGRVVLDKKLPEFFYKSHIKPLALIGRNTMIIYLLHQPIIYAVLTLIHD